jgi:hypothetical protein
MWVNPIPFGIFIGVASTIVVEVVALIIVAYSKGDKK